MGTTGAPTGGDIIRTDGHVNDKRTKASGGNQGPCAACEPSAASGAGGSTHGGGRKAVPGPTSWGHCRWHSSSRPQQVLGGQQPQRNGVVPLTWQRLPVTHTASSPCSSPLCGTRLPWGVPARAWSCLHDWLWGRHGLTPILQLGKLRPREAESS